MVLHRRRVMVGLAAGLAARPAAALVAKIGEVRVIDGIGLMRAMPPPQVLLHLISGKQASALTNPVLERSDAAPLRDFRDYLDRTVARERSPARKLELVNLYVNRRVKRTSDKALYGQTDLWAPPLNTLLAGGDCEDLALLKGWALLRLGFARTDLFLVAGVTRALSEPTFHAVLGVIFRPDDRVALLDNLSDTVQPSARTDHFDPTYALNEYGFWRIETPNAADKAYWDQITLDIQPKGAG